MYNFEDTSESNIFAEIIIIKKRKDMCSLTDSALDPALVEKKLAITDDKTCKKCRECISSVNLRAKDTYCRYTRGNLY